LKKSSNNSHTAPSSQFIGERDRSKIADEFKWNLAEVYPNNDSWRTAKEKLIGEFAEIEPYKGKVVSSPQALFACLDLTSRLGKEFNRLYCYASMNSDLDTRDATCLSMEQEMTAIGAEFAAKSSFIEPEILKVDKAAIDEFIQREPRLEIYRHNLYETLRRKEHTGSEGEEKIIADAGLMSDAPGTVYGVFSNADFPFAQIEMSDGKHVRLGKSLRCIFRQAE
jgi:oligoendopeptidase F